jgi:hypothetical protein
MRFYLFILSALFLFPATLKAQTADKYLQEWKAVDSLLKKGTYIIEYPAAVMTGGSFTKGIATIQSMYAPTFSGHSSGGRIKVK